MKEALFLSRIPILAFNEALLTVPTSPVKHTWAHLSGILFQYTQYAEGNTYYYRSQWTELTSVRQLPTIEVVFSGQALEQAR